MYIKYFFLYRFLLLIVLCSYFIYIPINSASHPLLFNTGQGEYRIGIGGSLSVYDIVVSQGGSVASPDIYVVVVNNGNSAIDINMSYDAEEPGISIRFSPSQFTLFPYQHKVIRILINTSWNTSVGRHRVEVYANVIKSGSNGVQVVYKTGVSATVIVLGTVVMANIEVAQPSGSKAFCDIRVVRVTSKGNYTVFLVRNTSSYSFPLPPGIYVVETIVEGRVANKTVIVVTPNDSDAKYIGSGEYQFIDRFINRHLSGGRGDGLVIVDPDEKRRVDISITVNLIYISIFDILPHYTDKGELDYVEIILSIINNDKSYTDVAVVLLVKRSNRVYDSVVMYRANRIDKGETQLVYRYHPLGSLARDKYLLQVVVKSGDRVLCVSREIEIVLGRGHSGWNLATQAVLSLVIMLAAISIFVWKKRLIKRR